MINLSLPVSDIQLNAICMDEGWAIYELFKCLKFASAHFDFIAVGAQDGSRAEPVFLN